MGVGMRARRSAEASAAGGRAPAQAPAEHGGDAPAGWCPACWEGEAMCPSCVGRRTRAFVQVEQKGRSVVDVAVELHLSPERVERLVEQERDRRSRPLFKKRPLLADAQWFIDDAL